MTTTRHTLSDEEMEILLHEIEVANRIVMTETECPVLVEYQAAKLRALRDIVYQQRVYGGVEIMEVNNAD